MGRGDCGGLGLDRVREEAEGRSISMTRGGFRFVSAGIVV
jgi:hypothetical protein